MTFTQFESSIEGSEPVEIYRFILGTETFEYTSAGDEITFAGIPYAPEPGMERNMVSSGRENRDRDMVIEVSGTNEFARKYISVVPGARARLTITRLQRNDFPNPEAVKIFDGFVRGVAFTKDGSKGRINITPTFAAASRPVPRFTYQSLCNHVLYDSGCKVQETDPAFRITAVVSNVVGNVITVADASTFPDGFFTSGFVEATSQFDIRMVIEHVGDQLTLLLPFSFNAIGENMVILAGCDHHISTCDQKFFTSEDLTSNVINFGGFAFVPTRNIFKEGVG